MEGIQVSVEKVGPTSDVSIIRVGGYIDTTTSSELERALDSLLKAGVFRVIIDLGNVDYISSAGWGIFISEIKGIRERGGDLKLAKMVPDVYEVFELLEFHYILKAFDTIEEAIHSFDVERGAVSLEDAGEETTDQMESQKPIITEIEKEAEPDDADTDTATIEKQIKKIAQDNPTFGSAQIAKELNTEKYGFIRMGKLSVWKVLRKLNMGDRKEQ